MRGRSSAFWVALAAVALLALVVRLAYFSQVESGPLGNRDTAAYEDLGAKLRAGEPYRSKLYGGHGGFPADLTRPPGYPAFLALVSSDPREHRQRAALVQLVISSLIAIAIALLTAALLESPVAGIAAGVVYALDWATIIHTPLAIADSVYPWALGIGVLLLAVALARERTPAVPLAVGGLLLGISCLVKPAAVVVTIGVALLLIALARPRPRAAIFIVAAALPVVPWMARNHREYDMWTVSPIPTSNLYFVTALGTYAYRSPISTNIDALETLMTSADLEWRRKRLSPPERARELRRRANERIREKPIIVADQAAAGLLRTAVGTGAETVSDDWSNGAPPPAVVTRWMPLGEIVFFWILAAAGVYLLWTTRQVPRRVVVFLVVALLLVLIPAASPAGYARFRPPATPIIALLAAPAAYAAWLRLQK